MFAVAFTQTIIIIALVAVALGTLALLGLLWKDYKDGNIW